MRYDPHRCVYVGAPEDDSRTDAQKAADAPLERKVSGVGGFLAGMALGAILHAVISGPRKHD